MPVFTLKTTAQPKEFEAAPGRSLVFLGANGAGKTRLGVAIEAQLSKRPSYSHRIAAQRSLIMNAKLVPPSLDEAERTLFNGGKNAQDDYNHTQILRWKQKPATQPLEDFSALLGALYAEETNVSINYRRSSLASKKRVVPPKTKLDKLKEIWESILTHRELVVLHNDVQVRPIGTSSNYSASEMSDGERLIFYMIGQCLMVRKSSTIIIDEPELHLNRSIMAPLWDAIESERIDCSFVYITHDIEFVNSRQGAEKYFVASIDFNAGPAWDIRSIPAESGIPDDVMGVIVGSRRPILFIEGEASSLDVSLYRRFYDNHTVIPLGSCDAVIHAVSSFSSNNELHHLTANGIIDLDGRTTGQLKSLLAKGIAVLPVSEVENLLLVPAVFEEIARLLHFSGDELISKIEELEHLIATVSAQSSASAALRYAKRQIDASIRTVDLKSKSSSEIQDNLSNLISSLNVQDIIDKRESEICLAISKGETRKLLSLIDQKGLLSDAAKILGVDSRRRLEEFVGRSLSSAAGETLRQRLAEVLPKF